MKLFYFFLFVYAFVIIPLVQVLTYWYSALYFLSILFIIFVFILSDKLLKTNNAKILTAVMIGFIFKAFNPVPKLDTLLSTNTFYFAGSGIVIPIPEMIQNIFSLPPMVDFFIPAAGFLGAMIGLGLFLLIHFIRNKYFLIVE